MTRLKRDHRTNLNKLRENLGLNYDQLQEKERDMLNKMYQEELNKVQSDLKKEH